MGRVKVTSVVEKPDASSVGSNPILVNFEHAPVKPDVNETLDLNEVFASAVFETDMSSSATRDMSHLSRSAFQNRLAERESRGAKRKQVVALQSDAMTYIGTKGFDSPNVLSSGDDLMRTYVAIKDKKKMKIFEVTPMTVSPYLRGYSHVVEESRKEEEDTTKEEKRAKGIDLMQTFGSKKKRLVYEKLEKNKIDIKDMKDSIDAAVSQLEVPESEPVIKDESVLSLIPPCNRTATYAHDVYHLEDVLTEGEIDLMEGVVQTFLDTSPLEMQKWKEKKTYSEYFLSMWNKLVPRRGSPKAVRTAKIVLYTELLIIFLKLRHDNIRKKNIDLPKAFPPFLREKVMDNFTTVNADGTRNRPDSYKDKTCCYIMVLVLLANDLLFDVQLMSLSLNIHIKKLLTLAKAVGITLTYNANTKEYKGALKLPLPKQIESRGRRRTLR